MADEQTQETPEQADPPAQAAKAPDPAVTVVNATAPVTPSRPEPAAPTQEQIARWKQTEAEFQALKAEDEKRKTAEAEAAEARLVEEGKLKEVIANKERLIAERDKKARENDARFRSTTRDSQLAFALANQKLTDGSPAQLLKLWRDELEVVEDGDSWKVQGRDGRPVAQFVAENLATGDYSKFVQAATKGGGPRSNADTAPPSKAPERPSAEQKQVDSLKKSIGQRSGNRFAQINYDNNN